MKISTTVRRAVVAGAIITGAATTVAVPSVAQAAPGTIWAAAQAAPATNDPVAQLASEALEALDSIDTERGRSAGTAYAERLDRVATAAAQRLSIDPARLRAAWQTADRNHQRALLAALTQLGTPYRKNTSKPGIGFDCSGLTTYAWSVSDVALPRQSTAQIRAAAKRDALTAQAGDLVQYPGHVMMWLGVDRAIIHAVGRGRSVELDHARARRSLRFGDPTG